MSVSVAPTSATIAAGETFLFTATVGGATNSAVTWSVTADSMTVVGGNSTIGFICPNSSAPQCSGLPAGTYIAPSVSPGAVTITATSAADTSASASASVVIWYGKRSHAQFDCADHNAGRLGAARYLFKWRKLSINKQSAGERGSRSYDFPYVFPPSRHNPIGRAIDDGSGSNTGATAEWGYFIAGDAHSKSITPRAGSVFARQHCRQCIECRRDIDGRIFIALHPGFLQRSAGEPESGGSTRLLQVTIPASDWGPPGLYPIVVQNTDVVPPNPGISAVNLAVEPTSFPTAPSASISVGAGPSAIAIDPALGLAAVANTGSNTVSIINLATNTQVPGSPVPVGASPTGVAIDDQLPHHLAVVVNNGSVANGGNSVTAIDLTTLVPTTVALPDTSVPPNTAALPYSIGINSLTHRAIVTQQSTNTAWILDLSSGVPVVLQQVGGSLTAYGTGPTPSVAIDPRLNWAIVTPGGSGVISIVDLGYDQSAGDTAGRLPVVIGTLSTTASTQGVGISGQTHQALLTDPNSGDLATYSLLDNSVSSVPFRMNGTTINELGFDASAINPLSNVGIAVNSLANTAAIVDMENSVVLQTVSGLSTPAAVAIDAVTNQAYVVNQGNNSVSVVTLGTAGQFRTLQIAESSPAVAFVTNPATSLTLTINGDGFSGTPQVVLDGMALPGAT